jgi:ribosome-binding factor A
MPKKLRSWLALGAVVLLATACAPPPESPEAQVRTLFGKAREAAEQKDLATLRRAVSDRYTDAHGNDRRAVEGILRLQFLRHESIHLFTRVSTVVFPEPDRAEATVYVAMAGRPIAEAEALTRLKADLYRFDFVLAKEGEDWKVIHADWRPAELGDFL